MKKIRPLLNPAKIRVWTALCLNLTLVMLFAPYPSAPATAQSETNPTEKVVLQLSLNHQLQYTGYYQALWQGNPAFEAYIFNPKHRQQARPERLDAGLILSIGLGAILLTFWTLYTLYGSREMLRRSEERYRGLFEHAPISLWEEDFSAVKTYLDGLQASGVTNLRDYFSRHPEAVEECVRLVKIVNLNKTSLSLYEADSEADLLGGLSHIFGPESLVVFQEELITLAEGHKVFEAESTTKTLKGNQNSISLKLTIMPGYEASWSRVLLSIIDITERRQVEESLRESEERFRRVLETVKLVAVMLDTEGNITFCNDFLLALTGWSKTETLGKNWFKQFIAPDLQNEIQSVFNNALGAGQFPYYYENDIVTRQGQARFIAWNNIAFYDRQGKVVGITSIGQDITERAQAEENLHQSEEKYRSVVAAMAEGVVLQTANGEIIAANSSAEQILGLTVDQMMGRTSLDPRWRAVHEDGSPFPGETHPAMVTLRTGQPCSKVIMGVHKPDGTLNWISINTEPLVRPEETKPYAVVASFSDITARKQSEAELRRLNEELEQRVRDRTDELQKMVNLMAGREVRMAELKEAIRQLRAQLEEAGLNPITNDPLLE